MNRKLALVTACSGTAIVFWANPMDKLLIIPQHAYGSKKQRFEIIMCNQRASAIAWNRPLERVDAGGIVDFLNAKNVSAYIFLERIGGWFRDVAAPELLTNAVGTALPNSFGPGEM